ncbi:MAG: hypothetical protein KDJ29_00260, partial [Hyphomicrobiales bacterium]|nr:hypothetical protein [Hyphomicrobiales bacterium]
MKLKNKTARALAVMTVVVAAPLFATAAHAQNTFAAFARGGYGYCDAKKVAAVWRNSIGQA